jgi:hypothetical protein
VKHQERPARGKTAKSGTAVSLLPMEIQIGDRFTDEGFEWQVLTHPRSSARR